MNRQTLCLLAGLCVAIGAVPVQAQNVPWSDRAGAAVALLDRQWGRPAGWDSSEAWQRFVIADAVLDYERRTGDRRWSPQVQAAVRDRSGLYLNDDDLWAVIANIHAWRLRGDPELLAYASSTYRRIVTTYWDKRCGGGLWWDRSRTYKNAITNELLIYASTQLFLATGQDSYREWAMRGWSWFSRSSMIGADGLVNDGLNAACRNNGQPHFTYNQGVLLGGLSDLTRITGDAQYRAAAVTTAIAAVRTLSTPQGILREPVDAVGSDGLMFKGIFAYHVGHLLEDMPDGPERRELATWVSHNAEAVWALSEAGKRPIDADWSGGTSQSGAAAHASGIDIMLAAASHLGGPPSPL